MAKYDKNFKMLCINAYEKGEPLPKIVLKTQYKRDEVMRNQDFFIFGLRVINDYAIIKLSKGNLLIGRRKGSTHGER